MKSRLEGEGGGSVQNDVQDDVDLQLLSGNPQLSTIV